MGLAQPMGAVLLLILVQLAVPLLAEFNYTKCPAAWELQSDFVKRNFSLKKFEGTYYEVALHDYTQYPICPSPKCIRSHKIVDYSLKQVNDSFDLQCFGEIFHIHFRFNFTNTTGHFLGTVLGFFPDIVFPNTVVDVYENSDGVYEWAIEFQCVEKLDHVWFIGINWYSRSNIVSEQYMDQLLAAARARGLGFYMEKVLQVDQKNCTYTGN